MISSSSPVNTWLNCDSLTPSLEDIKVLLSKEKNREVMSRKTWLNRT